MVLHQITAILTQSKVFLVDKPLHKLQMYSFHMKDIAISKEIFFINHTDYSIVYKFYKIRNSLVPITFVETSMSVKSVTIILST